MGGEGMGGEGEGEEEGEGYGDEGGVPGALSNEP